ncbi:hypothetical protein Trco_001111 [Trichoderma cornu-damae]|uniref:Uncharacterized protein n=1 Tax=Trichoderma cornu-damae TaxID=654480 RepID=A0A9P8TWZ2_9HYPO|nr:hypothetical protein Trco_001111 [Trichoderma cornu-damae]
MMQSSFGGPLAAEAFPSYHYDRFYDSSYTTAQAALSQVAQRLSSRGSAAQRAGTAMRVVKPSSTSTGNSPRLSAAKSRRRTMMNDSQTARRQQQVLEYIASTHDAESFQPTRRQSRPVSWHPSTQPHVPQAVEFIPQQPFYDFAPSAMQHSQHELYHFAPQPSPPMTSYSNNTSPSSTFSPLPPSYQAAETMAHESVDGWQAADPSAPYYSSLNDEQFTMPSAWNGCADERPSAGTTNWNSYIYHGFTQTSPPTPDSFLQTSQPSQSAAPEAAIQALDEPEEEGEILIGMGLYDTPGKYEEDPHLNNYRSTVSSLLGSSFRPLEPTGKGLKLEETWEPPKSDDEEEEEEEDEEEDEEEEGEEDDDN